MTEEKSNQALQPLPNILRLRAERILKKAVKVLYRINVGSPIVKAEMFDGPPRFVDLTEKKEIQAVEPKDQALATQVPEKTVSTGNFSSTITRSNVEPPAKKGDETTKKKTSTKKKSTTAKPKSAK